MRCCVDGLPNLNSYTLCERQRSGEECHDRTRSKLNHRRDRLATRVQQTFYHLSERCMIVPIPCRALAFADEIVRQLLQGDKI
jgi:hypothetical protein